MGYQGKQLVLVLVLVLASAFTPSAFSRFSARGRLRVNGHGSRRGLAECQGSLFNVGGDQFLDPVTNRTFCEGPLKSPSADTAQLISASRSASNTFWASETLYRTAAAISHPSNLSYLIDVSASTQGGGDGQPPPTQMWIRLHFAAFKGNIPFDDPFRARFDVSANGVLLLSNYSATADAADSTVTPGSNTGALNTAVMREFIIPFSPTLSLTISPRRKSYAFINGIEVTAVPLEATYNGTALFVPAITQTPEIKDILTTQSFAVKHRLQTTGFLSVSGDQDKMARTWLNADRFQVDFFGKKGFLAATDVVNADKAPYFVPQTVAKTNRELGDETQVAANLSYSFPVPRGAWYWIRLFFAENEYSNIGDRVMTVYVNGRTMFQEFDILKETEGTQAFLTSLNVVYLLESSADTDAIKVEVGPSTRSRSKNPAITALEIMRIGNTTLASPTDVTQDLLPPASQSPPPGPMDAPYDSLSYNNSSSTSSSTSNNSVSTGLLVLAILGGILAALFLAALLFLLYIWYRRHHPLNDKTADVSSDMGEKEEIWADRGDGSEGVRGRPFSLASRSTGGGGRSGSRAGSGSGSGSARERASVVELLSGDSSSSGILNGPATPLWREFSLIEVERATDDWNPENMLGEGGFGKVYKGKLASGVLVAVKRANAKTGQGNAEFETEVVLLSKLRNKNLVSLLGVCTEAGEMILVYEHMAQGPLRKHLYGSSLPPLSWKRRLEVARGAARGIQYLHTGFSAPIIHRDVKSTNILLDASFGAKISDFGLSKLGPGAAETHVSTEVKGSFGYLDPEYFKRQQLSEKSDVYSFGVVLLELLCARPVINTSLPRDQASLADWAVKEIKAGRVHEIVDPRIQGQMSDESLDRFVETALKCLADYGEDRPSIGSVLFELESALIACGSGTPRKPLT